MPVSAQEIVTYWKNMLGLNSWEITVKEVPRHEQDTCAETFIKPQMERASLSVWRISDRSEEDDPIELDILHELVHVRLWAIDPHEATGVHNHCRESAIEWIARALYNASNFENRVEKK